MKIDNFTTARCNKCGWIKQFQPGKEYEAKEFICNCKEVVIETPTKGKTDGKSRSNSTTQKNK